MSLKHFNTPWNKVPVCVLDFETTGLTIGVDKVCQVGIARYEDGKLAGHTGARIDPGIQISEAATAVHGITNAAVAGCMSIDEFFPQSHVQELLRDAQLCAYNAPFDRAFVPATAGIDLSWPWLDPLVLVRNVDKYVSGQGRHTLPRACERHGVALSSAHDAVSDAIATGELLYKLVPKVIAPYATLGELLQAQQEAAAEQWFSFNSWLSKQQAPK